MELQKNIRTLNLYVFFCYRSFVVRFNGECFGFWCFSSIPETAGCWRWWGKAVVFSCLDRGEI